MCNLDGGQEEREVIITVVFRFLLKLIIVAFNLDFEESQNEYPFNTTSAFTASGSC